MAREDAPPLPVSLLGEHELELKQLALSADGARLVTADAQGNLAAFQLKDGSELWRAKRQFEAAGLDVGLGTVAVGIPGTNAVEFFRLGSGDPDSGIGGPRHDVGATAVVFDPKERWIWMGTDKGVLIRLQPGNVNGWSQHPLEGGAVTCMADDEAGKLLAIGSSDGNVRFVNPASANVEEKKVCEGHAGPVTALALDGKGALLATGGEDRSVRLWKVASAKQLELLGAHEAAVSALAFDPKGGWIASGDAGGALILWDAKKKKRLRAIELEGFGGVRALCALDGGKRLAAARGTKLSILDLAKL
jgi:WD40 repeat protein